MNATVSPEWKMYVGHQFGVLKSARVLRESIAYLNWNSDVSAFC